MTAGDLPNEGQTEKEKRDVLEARIAARLPSLDDLTLAQLDQWTQEAGAPPKPTAEPVARLNRRRFLTTLAVGGVALVASNTATALIALDRGKMKGETQSRAELNPRIVRLQDLLALYERLEKVSLDDAVKLGMAAVGLVIRALREGAKILRAGLDIADVALTATETALAKLQEGFELVEELVNQLAKRVEALWALLVEVTGVAIPLAQSVGTFFKNILQKIPFGVGAKIKQAIEWIEALVAQLPDALAHIKARLLAPLRAEWLGTTPGSSLQTRLISPLRGQVLDPARQLVAEIEDLGVKWEIQMEKPVQAALQERAAIRAQIARYKREQHLA